MRRLPIAVITLATALLLNTPFADADSANRRVLHDGWKLQSSAKLTAAGDAISKAGFDTAGWHTITVPNTVLGALVENGTYPDPYFGMNLRKIPGTTYPINERFTLLPTPDDSPFKPTWWYRTEFTLPASAPGRSHWVHFNGINYSANIWVNGQRIASKDEVAGAFRRYEFDITPFVHAGANNAIAVEVRGPEPGDLAITWVDWNPNPPDKDMGLWGDVFLTDSGPIQIRNPYVVPTLDLPSLQRARLTVSADVVNATDRPVNGTVRGTIESIRFEKAVALAPHERKTITFTPDEVAGLTITNPRVWWPYRYGQQPLYTLSLSVDAGGARSDKLDTRFGIQQVTSELTDKGYRLYKVNGKPILIRGGGWASDMLLRTPTPDRLQAEFNYVKEMGLNTIRLEGKLETDEFFDLADRMGILIMPGWCCCDQWEQWAKWDPEDHRVSVASLRDQALRLRNHPSIFVWLNGSDNPPTAAVEKAYLDTLQSVNWCKPTLSNATDQPGPVSGPSGVKMRGPYDYEPPSYWLTDTKNGGAFGFATEISPGAAPPPIESLREMLPPEHLWPIDEFWNYHATLDMIKDVHRFTAALEARYGKATGVEDYARKAQAMTYDGERAMFEGYGRNKYTSTGVIQWMLNNAWPSVMWHLYDYYLRPGGGYFGTKKACEPVHVQYSYDDRSIAIVNDTYQAAKGLKLSAKVFDLNLVQKFRQDATIDAPADAVARSFTIPQPDDVNGAYFVRLDLTDTSGRLVSHNFYWLSTKDDVLDWADNTNWFYTPTKQHGDLTALGSLPATTLTVTMAPASAGKRARVVVRNTGKALAFQVRLKAVDKASGKEILPVYWQDNYFELFPGESREIEVSWAPGASAAKVVAEAWNAR